MLAQPTETPVEFESAALSWLNTVRSMLRRELQFASATYSGGVAAGYACVRLPCSAVLLAGKKAGSRYRDWPGSADVPVHERWKN